jgi:hypothetical protein
MSTLQQSFSALATELSYGLRAAGHVSLADQVDTATIDRVTFDEQVKVAYIYRRPVRVLNALETEIARATRLDSFEVETRYWTVIDYDTFGRL